MDEHTPDYERLCLSIYAYQFGSSGFAALVDLLMAYELDSIGGFSRVGETQEGL